MPIFCISLSIAAVFAWGCDKEETSAGPSPTITYNGADHTLDFDFDGDESGFLETCTDFIKVYKGEGSSRARLGRSALADAAWDGYYLDGEFVNPNMGEGCDVLACSPLAKTSRTVMLAEYEQGEDHVFTDEEKTALAAVYQAGPSGEVPDSVATFVSVPYSGPVSVEITYSPVEECHENSGNSVTVTDTFMAE